MALVYSSLIHKCLRRYCSLDSFLNEFMIWIFSEFFKRDDLSKTLLNENESVAGSRYALFWNFLSLEDEADRLYRNVGREIPLYAESYPSSPTSRQRHSDTQWQGCLPKLRLAVGSAEGAVETAAATSKSYNNEHTHTC